MSQLIRLCYLSHRRPAKAQASLCIRTVSPEPSLFAHMKYGSRWRVWPKIRHLAPLNGCTCMFEKWVYGGRKVPLSHELAQILKYLFSFHCCIEAFFRHWHFLGYWFLAHLSQRLARWAYSIPIVRQLTRCADWIKTLVSMATESPHWLVMTHNEDMHKILDEFKFQPDRTTDYRVSYPWASKTFLIEF